MSRELGTVDHGRLLEAFSVEAQLLADVAHSASPDSPVPTAPGWTLNELVQHVGSMYQLALGWLREGRQPAQWQRDPLPGQPVAEFYDAAREELAAELSVHDPVTRAATWWPADPTHGFWRRRMLHETLVHRVDAENAAGTGEPAVPDDLAADGVDEALTLYFGHRLTTMGVSGTRSGTVGFHTGGHSWIARAGPGETEAWRCSPPEADTADAIVTGPPANVYLWLWGRVPVTMVHTDGDHELSAQTWALLRLATR
ncbi:maleylpyruvate isomerase family mycothiol-dependent enzyme [Amycolatopsis jejuensis]|uniref:maleylpyruvate isomerase family mycothiol-dependent enzyme n=1 Tax=Amycolatopsis jejuensis TaxID=330084 RepID=UPI0005261CC7|nr:maleylpyruvate isomerase family mycothiol-dependent enzyme [Amycolatopsis jejuensis]